jgi:hypothetical protein
MTKLNLDGMSINDLKAFSIRYYRGRGHQVLFPDRERIDSKLTVTKLAVYARYRALEMEYRLCSHVADARMVEQLCGVIYISLPDYARWSR